MKEGSEIGKITFKIDPENLKQIVHSGRLEDFVAKATEIFRRDLKAELVKETVSSVETSLFFFDGDEFLTGPRPPWWHNIAQIDQLATRIQALEQIVLKVGR